MPKLSDLDPDDVSLVSKASDDSGIAPLKLSDMKPGEAQLVQAASPSGAPSMFAGDAKSAIDSLPILGGVAGGILGTPADAVTGPMGSVVGAGIGGYIGTAAKNLINRYYDPASAPQTNTQALTQPIVGGAEQGAMQGIGEAAAPILSKGAQATADALSSFAAKKAVAATGATGKQALKFAPGAGQELLDQGIVQFGDSQGKIAEKASDALERAGNKIGSVLTDLDNRGATLDQADVIDSLRKRASQLGKDPSQYGVSDSLNKLADRMESSIQSSGGNSEIPLSEAENTKRGFQAGANYNSAPLDLSVSKEVAGIYQKAVENAATKFDPDAANAFKDAKKAYGLLSPIQDAAEKRAATIAQSPHGGLLDTAATIAGEGIGGIPGAIAAPIARRAIAPRVASSMAASANAAAGALSGIPAVASRVAPIAAQVIAPSATVPPIGGAASGLMELPAAARNNPAQPASSIAQLGPNRTPATGPDAWAQQGVTKLGLDSGTASRALLDPKGKQLLIQASDLTPNSNAMKKLMSQIQSKWGNN